MKGGQTFTGNVVLTVEDAGNANQPVVIGSYDTGRAVINAGEASGILWKNCGGVVVRDLVFRGNGIASNRGSGVAIINELPGNQKKDFVLVSNVTASGFGADELGWKGCGIFIGGLPADGSKSGYNNVLIEGCTTHTCEYLGIWVSGNWQDEPTTYANANVVIRNSVAHDITGDISFTGNWSGSGIFVEDCAGGRIEYCVACNNGSKCGAVAGPTGIWTAVSRDFCIQYCESYNNNATQADGDGFDLDNGCINDTIQYCYSHDNKGAGYLICTGDKGQSPWTNENLVLRYNISENDGRNSEYGGIHIGTGSDKVRNIHAYHNTVVNTIASYGAPFTAEVWYPGNYDWSEVHVRNNIFYSTGEAVLIKNNLPDSIMKFEGNCYYTTGSVLVKENGTSYNSLTSWRAACGQEKMGEENTGLEGNPMLAAPGKGGTVNNLHNPAFLSAYTLQGGSRAIDAGLDLNARFSVDVGRIDFYGTIVPQGRGYDIGACEHRVDAKYARHAP